MRRVFLICLLLLSVRCFSQPLSVVKLRCENKQSPLGIETQSPSLSWQIISKKRATLQTAYRILVADDSSLLHSNKGNLWDSQKVLSDQSIQVAYKGKRLLSAKTYYWKVIVWDSQKKSSAWSPVSSWQMGLMEEGDWKGAKWVGYEEIPDSLIVVPAEHQKGPAKRQGVKDVLPLLRTTLIIKKPVKKAIAFV